MKTINRVIERNETGVSTEKPLNSNKKGRIYKNELSDAEKACVGSSKLKRSPANRRDNNNRK